MPAILPTLLGAGVLGTIIAGALALVRIAIAAERRRADDWRTAAQTSAQANLVLTGHFDKLIHSVEQLAVSQREMMTVLQTMSAELRRPP